MSHAVGRPLAAPPAFDAVTYWLVAHRLLMEPPLCLRALLQLSASSRRCVAKVLHR